MDSSERKRDAGGNREASRTGKRGRHRCGETERERERERERMVETRRNRQKETDRQTERERERERQGILGLRVVVQGFVRPLRGCG